MYFQMKDWITSIGDIHVTKNATNLYKLVSKKLTLCILVKTSPIMLQEEELL